MNASTPRYYLGANRRLKKRKAIEQLFQQGRSITHFPFRLVWQLQATGAPLQMGISVSKRRFAHATHRNKIKRYIREAWRHRYHPLEQQLQASGQSMQVFIIYTATHILEPEIIAGKMQEAIQKLQKQVHA